MSRITISVTNNILHDRRMLRSAKSLEANGFKVHIIGRRKSEHNAENISHQTTLINCWLSKGFLFYLEFNIRLFWKLLFSPLDILLAVDSDTLLANSLVRFIRRKTLVVDMHELFIEVPELRQKPIKKAIWGLIERMGIKVAAACYTVNDSIARYYQNRYGKEFQVVRNVPSLESYPNPEKSEHFTLAYLGVINQGRGLEECLVVIKQLPKVHMIIIGKGDLYNEMLQLVEQLDIGDRVSFVGWQDPESLIPILATSTVGINLLDPESASYHHSLANKYFDYIHAGIPSISMNFPEYRHLNQHYETSILIDNLSNEEISRAIDKLQDQITYARLVDNCLKARLHWNWQNESPKMLSIFNRFSVGGR